MIQSSCKLLLYALLLFLLLFQLLWLSNMRHSQSLFQTYMIREQKTERLRNRFILERLNTLSIANAEIDGTKDVIIDSTNGEGTGIGGSGGLIDDETALLAAIAEACGCRNLSRPPWEWDCNRNCPYWPLPF